MSQETDAINALLKGIGGLPEARGKSFHINHPNPSGAQDYKVTVGEGGSVKVEKSTGAHTGAAAWLTGGYGKFKFERSSPEELAREIPPVEVASQILEKLRKK